LFSWLRELVYLFSASSVVFTRFKFSALTSGRLEAVARGTPFDPARHVSKMEVKAVTRHQFSLSHTPAGGWEARVIFDV
jgi:SHS2 domain-containing protein